MVKMTHRVNKDSMKTPLLGGDQQQDGDITDNRVSPQLSADRNKAGMRDDATTTSASVTTADSDTSSETATARAKSLPARLQKRGAVPLLQVPRAEGLPAHGTRLSMRGAELPADAFPPLDGAVPSLPSGVGTLSEAEDLAHVVGEDPSRDFTTGPNPHEIAEELLKPVKNILGRCLQWSSRIDSLSPSDREFALKKGMAINFILEICLMIILYTSSLKQCYLTLSTVALYAYAILSVSHQWLLTVDPVLFKDTFFSRKGQQLPTGRNEAGHRQWDGVGRNARLPSPRRPPRDVEAQTTASASGNFVNMNYDSSDEPASESCRFCMSKYKMNMVLAVLEIMACPQKAFALGEAARWSQTKEGKFAQDAWAYRWRHAFEPPIAHESMMHCVLLSLIVLEVLHAIVILLGIFLLPIDKEKVDSFLKERWNLSDSMVSSIDGMLCYLYVPGVLAVAEGSRQGLTKYCLQVRDGVSTPTARFISLTLPELWIQVSILSTVVAFGDSSLSWHLHKSIFLGLCVAVQATFGRIYEVMSTRDSRTCIKIICVLAVIVDAYFVLLIIIRFLAIHVCPSRSFSIIILVTEGFNQTCLEPDRFSVAPDSLLLWNW